MTLVNRLVDKQQVKCPNTCVGQVFLFRSCFASPQPYILCNCHYRFVLLVILETDLLLVISFRKCTLKVRSICKETICDVSWRTSHVIVFYF